MTPRSSRIGLLALGAALAAMHAVRAADLQQPDVGRRYPSEMRTYVDEASSWRGIV